MRHPSGGLVPASLLTYWPHSRQGWKAMCYFPASHLTEPPSMNLALP
jgi:hypothetical protein